MGEEHVPKTKDARGEEGPEGDEPENYEPGAKMTRTAPGSLMTVLKHSDWKDMVLMGLGTLGSVADGLSMASIMIILSNLMNGYASSSLGLDDINKYAMDLLYVAVGVGSGAFLEGFCWARTAERQCFRLRRRYLEAVLRKDVGFFERSDGKSMTSQVVSSISVDTITIQGVLTEKIANFIMNITMFITGQIAAVYLCWRLAVVTIPALTMLIVPGLVYGKLLKAVGEKIQQSYEVAEGIMIIQQAFSSIRTVYSYVGEERTAKRYRDSLEPTLKLGIEQGLVKGMAIGTVGITFAVWALQGWYGSILVSRKEARGGDVFTTGVMTIYGGLALGSSLMNVKYFAEANAAAARIFEMIEHVPDINSSDKKGKTMLSIRGEIEFKDVDFAYPSRPLTSVLRRFNLKVDARQTIGLVGRSGSGKSTIINLVQRFYDPTRGEVLLDGTEIRNLQLGWLRSQMGLVSQEAILFATSIKENIMFGKEGASMEEIIEAAKAANAHDFITQLPNGYNTQVGQLGIQMSEGQKQRISIARALLRDPRILLLDEATSALDSHSEKAVQDALNQASIGRTTIIVAHRLSALCNADLIAVVHAGQIVESGCHDQLRQIPDGMYSMMVTLQRTANDNKVDSTVKGASEDEHSLSIRKRTTLLQELHIDLPSGTGSSNPRNTDIEQKDPEQSPPSLGALVRMTSPEWKSTMLGCLGAVSYGIIQPLHSYCLGALVAVYVVIDRHKVESQTRLYCLAFLSFAVFSFITNVLQHYFFGIVGENLVKRVREALLMKILTFETEWFDLEENSSGALCSRLAVDAAMVRSLVADRLSFLAQAICSATLAVILAMFLSWKLALVATAMQPLVIASFYIRAIMMKTMSKKILRAQNRTGELASEAVANHRIVTAFESQEKVLKLYELTQMGPRKVSRRQSWFAALGLFISQFLTAANTAVMFWYGGKLLYKGEVTYKQLFQTFFVLVSTGRVIAETGSMTADLSKGTNALEAIFTILSRKTKMDPDNSDGLNPEKIEGGIRFKRVDFFYPTRPKQLILCNLSLRIDAGKVVALVGQSGSGKSTIIRLIERFYDPSRGSVEVDGIDIKSYNLRSLRSHIALVSQEPTLFAGTIHENIAYGKETATETEIIAAATIANAHEFISSMKDGYETYCGERGVQLSGGQKQRISLARAILKNPAILLLDEATGALDSESETLVQDALDRTMVGRTCLVVAHRLSTVQKADKISVIGSGRVLEEGTHSELLALGDAGSYFSLVRLQQLSAGR